MKRANPNVYVKGSYVNEPEPEVIALMADREEAWDDGWDECAEETFKFLLDRADTYNNIGRREARDVLVNAAKALKEASA